MDGEQAVRSDLPRIVPSEPTLEQSEDADAEVLPLWHVRVVLAGEPVDPEQLRGALVSMCTDGTYLGGVRYAADRVELTYWDEAEDVDDAAALALRVWNDHRQAVGLPSWTVVGLEVLDRDTQRAQGLGSGSVAVGDVRPL